VGLDADLVLIDPDDTYTVRAGESESQQGYSPFEGVELTARVKSTYLRGRRVYHDGDVVGEPTGRFMARPY
jgi:allantoinase